MPRSNPMQTAFNSGEWSPLMEGHINLENWADSCTLLQNLIALKQGPITRRGGTKFVKEVNDSSNNTILVPFEFSTTQAYQIEMGNNYYRFYKDNAAVVEATKTITGATKADPVTITTSASHGYSNGDEVYIDSVGGMTQLNGRFFKIKNVTSTTFQITDFDDVDIDGTAYNTYSSGGTSAKVYELASSFAASDLLDSDDRYKFQFAQSADVLYIAHPDYQTIALTRTSDTSWTETTLDFDDGPYLPINDTTTTLTLSGTTGSVTVTASATTGINGGDGFQTTDVGRLIRWEDPANNWTWLEITARASTTSVTATIKGPDASATTATTDWRLGLWSDTTGWPKVVSFYQDRIFLANCADYPDKWSLSRSGGYSDTELLYAPTDADGTVTDDASITGTLQSGKVNAIQWAGSDDRGLILGSKAKEWLIRPSASNEVLTQSNAKSDPFSSVGSDYIQPIQAENGTLFAQNARRKLFDIIYNFESDQLKPRDLTIASEHITRGLIAQIQHQQEPINTAWIRMKDGTLKGMTYYPTEAVFAMHRHVLGGTDVDVKSISVIPSADGDREELWMIVQRTINGNTKQYVEYMTRYYEDDIDQEDSITMDCTLTYDGSATSTISGLHHLEGETVKLLVDGKSHNTKTVSGGSITLDTDTSGSVIQVGLGNTWAYKSQKIEGGAAAGVSQGKTKRITGLVIRLLNTLGLKYGPNSGNVKEYDFDQGDGFDEVTPLFSGDTEFLRWPEGYEQDGYIYLESDDVHPVTILALMPELTTYER